METWNGDGSICAAETADNTGRHCPRALEDNQIEQEKLSKCSPSSPQVMNAFYRRLFPYRPFFLWMNQDNGECPPIRCLPVAADATTADHTVPSKLFTHREFAFTLANDVYIRYNSFYNIDEFKREILRLNPSRFEIGPQYNARVRQMHLLWKTQVC